ncbi:hypothetical protein C1J03_18970 [Sulfitobacter sp. SK012]|uniref:hypothetical protein n=1 Tax=Sulfitobacter sp. SK012 TaxID=1389005 RepID=UPI000E09F79F|nr:hypothetical protein [Sulfitobacter sp. SK012]AXI47903.1 hypothetical protein C1J03_18970 [Sulfitobacter sp. SK012]
MIVKTKSKKALTILPLIAVSIFLSACSDNIDNRQDRRDDRQDCRQDEGIVGGDKRDCKQEERAAG